MGGGLITPRMSMMNDAKAVSDELRLAPNRTNELLRNGEIVFFSSMMQVISGGETGSRRSSDFNKTQKRGIMVTEKAVYELKAKKLNVARRRVLLPLVREVVVASDSSLAVLLHIPSQEDMLLVCPTLDSLQRLVTSVSAFGDFQRAHLRHKQRHQEEDDNPESDVLGGLPLMVTTRSDDTFAALELAAATSRDGDGLMPASCGGCGRHMSRRDGAYVNSYDGRSMHADCFRCMICDTLIADGQQFYSGRCGMPLCKRHGSSSSSVGAGAILNGKKPQSVKVCQYRAGPKVQQTFVLRGLKWFGQPESDMSSGESVSGESTVGGMAMSTMSMNVGGRMLDTHGSELLGRYERSDTMATDVTI